MKCAECRWYDKEYNSCDCGPYEMDDHTCLLKNIVCILLHQAEEEDDDFWKK